MHSLSILVIGLVNLLFRCFFSSPKQKAITKCLNFDWDTPTEVEMNQQLVWKIENSTIIAHMNMKLGLEAQQYSFAVMNNINS